MTPIPIIAMDRADGCRGRFALCRELPGSPGYYEAWDEKHSRFVAGGCTVYSRQEANAILYLLETQNTSPPLFRRVFTFECGYQDEVSAFVKHLNEQGGLLLFVNSNRGVRLNPRDYYIVYEHTNELGVEVRT